jgi:parallel beta-helix repeat protein
VDRRHRSGHIPREDLNTTFGYDTIQEAISAGCTLNGDILIVKSGIYKENLQVNKSLTIRGADKSTTIIDANHNGTAVRITVPNVTLSGFTVQNSKAGGACIFLEGAANCTNITVENQNIVNAYIGIHLVLCQNCTVRGNTMQDNIQELNYASEIQGIRLTCSSNNLIQNNSIIGHPRGIVLFQETMGTDYQTPRMLKFTRQRATS